MKNIKGSLLLLLTAIIWGTSFVSQKLGMNYIEPFTFGASRFLLGALTLIPVILLFDKINSKKNDSEKSINTSFNNKDLIVGGILCGCALFLGASFQQFGIVHTTAGKAGFITALYMVLVPIIGIFMGKKTDLYTWIGVVIAVIGLYLLSIKEGFSIGKGDAIVLMGTIFWAVHIITVDRFVSKVDGVKLSCIQFLTAGTLSLIASFIAEEPRISEIIDCAGPILYSAILSVGVAYTLQIIGQKYTNPTLASILMSLESVFSAISGAIYLKESMLAREIFGCVLVFIAVLIAQINPKEILESIRSRRKAVE
jgi:drug/metabolite transporter (DMT)-like permease